MSNFFYDNLSGLYNQYVTKPAQEYIVAPLVKTIDKQFPGATSSGQQKAAKEDLDSAVSEMQSAIAATAQSGQDLTAIALKVAVGTGASFGLFTNGAQINSTLYAAELLVTKSLSTALQSVRSVVEFALIKSITSPWIVPAVGAVSGLVSSAANIKDLASHVGEVAKNTAYAIKDLTTATNKYAISKVLDFKMYLEPDAQTGTFEGADREIFDLQKALNDGHEITLDQIVNEHKITELDIIAQEGLGFDVVVY